MCHSGFTRLFDVLVSFPLPHSALASLISCAAPRIVFHRGTEESRSLIRSLLLPYICRRRRQTCRDASGGS